MELRLYLEWDASMLLARNHKYSRGHLIYTLQFHAFSDLQSFLHCRWLSQNVKNWSRICHHAGENSVLHKIAFYSKVAIC